MQSINKIKHKHLTDALQQLAHLLKQNNSNAKTVEQAAIYHQELETMMTDYDRLIAELAILIEAYHTTYDQVKIRFLGVKLKELKKEVPERSPVFYQLRQNIQQVHGT